MGLRCGNIIANFFRGPGGKDIIIIKEPEGGDIINIILGMEAAQHFGVGLKGAGSGGLQAGELVQDQVLHFQGEATIGGRGKGGGGMRHGTQVKGIRARKRRINFFPV